MKNFIIFINVCLLLWGSQGLSVNQQIKDSSIENGVIVELISNGSMYSFTSMADGLVITVLPNGDVISDVWANRPEQKWIIMKHPTKSQFLEFKQLVVPYNMLSGYEDLPENPGVYPRALSLNSNRIMTNSLKRYLNAEDLSPVPWQIIIGGRFCLQNNGLGRILDIDDCELMLPAPREYWDLKIVE